MDDDNKIKNPNSDHPELDFLASLVLIGVSIAVIITSYGYYLKQHNGYGKHTFYASAGFMPILISVALIISSIILMLRSLEGSSIKQRFIEIGNFFSSWIKDSVVHKAFIGLLIMGFYVYVLLGNLPFWLATFIGLTIFLFFLNFKKDAKTIIKLLLISIFATGGIVLVFQIIFRVPMP
ncbi:MAG: tripartite tricarboxylate transporter TctB family protein [Sphaerochaetaceae bacterium]|nr:tripartite tricarboxylate transporter TctB family protein [Sphaerochaetaceae bacterium]